MLNKAINFKLLLDRLVLNSYVICRTLKDKSKKGYFRIIDI